MKGDFSQWDFDSLDNEIGVVHQQGRGLLDQDWNAATFIAAAQRQIQARDAIGPFVAAVPAEVNASFKVTQAEADANGVNITLNPGRIWVNGFVIDVTEWLSMPQVATYLEPPFHASVIDTSSIDAGVRDAVILEIWRDTLNAFQDSIDLLEPALGGVDTTERAKLFHQLRLLRLEPDDDCGNLAEKLADDFSSKGTLTVTAEEILVTGDCPVDAGGGYTGFEHYLIRVEIADPDGNDARFKWSRFNGGLVGRGKKSTTADKVAVQANDQMINHCGLTNFYLEAVEKNAATGVWEVTFTADATLSADSELGLTSEEEIEADDPLAFLYEIRIDDNKIMDMGLSGIGIPFTTSDQSSHTLQVGIGNPVIGLTIHRNHIGSCLRNPFEGDLLTEAEERGFGGIALGICERVWISENRIEQNGLSHMYPVCGIYLHFCTETAIDRNVIVHNAPATAANKGLIEGKRGGLVLIASSSGIESSLIYSTGGQVSLDTGRPAARIHDNVVLQPAGQCLQLAALGPLSIAGNHFETVLPGPAAMELFAGAVLVIQIGGEAPWPNGLFNFHGNQTRLGHDSATLMSQMLFFMDDIAFADNQSVALGDGQTAGSFSVLLNTMLAATTVRAAGNRFKESTGDSDTTIKISLYTKSKEYASISPTKTKDLNSTTHNQGDHCIFAVSDQGLVDATGTQVLDDTVCSTVGSFLGI